MKIISRIFSAFVLIIIFGFALKNMQEVALQFFLGYEIKGPLALILFGVFVTGSVMGVLAMTPTFFRQRRELNRTKKTIATMQKQSEAQELVRVQPPQPDSIVNQ
ncbi:hypothetical protein BH11PSE11_BH11PSE11_36970 [soil metagenome]